MNLLTMIESVNIKVCIQSKQSNSKDQFLTFIIPFPLCLSLPTFFLPHSPATFWDWTEHSLLLTLGSKPENLNVP